MAQLLFDYLRDAMYHPEQATLDTSKLSKDFSMLGEGLQFFVECLLETNALAKALSKGDLSGKLPSPDNEMAAPLKALHATLRHLTWQTQQVAKGDYNQHIDFMGDFAEAFNTMTKQLDERRTALLDEIEKNVKKSKDLTRSNSLFEAITAEITQWIIMIDKESGEILFANRHAADVLEQECFHKQLHEWLIQMAMDTLDDAEPRDEEINLSHEGAEQYFSASLYLMHWYEHNAVAFVMNDITGTKAQIMALEDVAYHDPLTKIYNRHYGMKTLGEWIEAKSSFIICFIDMDNLKYVNDKFGHAEGDKYILCVADLLHKFSQDVKICRLGGDEFMLLAKNWGIADAERRLEELRDVLVTYNNKPGAFYNHSLSYGVIEVTAGNAYTASELLSIADEKMYAYKRAHKAQRVV
ncbi:diguanylate cyclase [Lachnospiraceae bacterium ZAX-1]